MNTQQSLLKGIKLIILIMSVARGFVFSCCLVAVVKGENVKCQCQNLPL